MYRIFLLFMGFLVVRIGMTAPVYVEHDWLAKHLNNDNVVVVDTLSEFLDSVQ